MHIPFSLKIHPIPISPCGQKCIPSALSTQTTSTSISLTQAISHHRYFCASGALRMELPLPSSRQPQFLPRSRGPGKLDGR